LNPVLSKNRLRPAIWNIVNQNSAAALVLGGWTTFPPEKIQGTYISDYALTRQKDFLGSYYPVSKTVDGLLSYQPEVSSWPADLQKYLSKDAKTFYLWKNRSSFVGENTRLIFSYYYSTDAFGHHFGTYIDRKSATPADKEKNLQ